MSTSPVTANHTTVLLNEAVNGLSINPSGIYIDGTFGRGGHSKLILSMLNERGRLIAIDRDPRAILEAEKITDGRFQIEHDRFSNLVDIVNKQNLIGKIDGILLDLGISSPQIDEAERGFSFMNNGPLDMRMDDTKGQSAAEWLNNASENEIEWVIKHYGEERNAKRIAKKIINYVNKKPIESTLELANLIEGVNHLKKRNKHPATRSFQAIRMHINNELGEIEQTLNSILNVLNSKGRIAIISFHSLEDRIIKQFIVNNSKKYDVPKGLPLTDKQLDTFATAKLINHGKIKPSELEIKANPRARSAILRIAEKI